MFLRYRIYLLLQFPWLLKFKPNSFLYTHDYPSTLLFETQERIFTVTHEFPKNSKFVEHISHIVLVFPLLTLNKQMLFEYRETLIQNVLILFDLVSNIPY